MMWRTMVIVVLLSSAVKAQQPLSIIEAINRGVQNSKTLKASGARVDAASARVREVRSNLLPSIKFDVGYRRLSDVSPFQINVPFYPQPITIAPTVLDNYSLHLGIQQPLFTGFRLLSNARAAKYLSDASESDNRNDQSELILSITTVYWTLYQTMQTKEYINENVDRLESYENDTKNLMNAGMATRNDLLRIQVQLSNARLTAIDASNDVEIATMNLNNLIGQPIETSLRITSQPDTSPIPVINVNELSNQAFASRPDFQAMQLRVEASKLSLLATSGGYWPQFFLTGNYYYQKPNQRYQPTRDEFKSTWDVGVQLQFDVWNWGATSAQEDQAQATLTQNELIFEQLKENVVLDVKRSALAVQRSREKVGVAKLAIEQAEENTRSMQDKFKNGLATSTELLDASVALLQAKTTYSGALVEQEIARARLSKAVGK